MSKQKMQTHTREPSPGKCYDRVYIIGPGHDKAFVEAMHAELKKTSLSYCIIGDGNRSIVKGQITRTLKGKIGPGTHVTVWGHGNAINGVHYIRLMDTHPSATAAVFKTLSSCYTKDTQDNGVGLNVNLLSCFAGAAVKDVTNLPKGSVLVAEASRRHITWAGLNQKTVLRGIRHSHEADAFVEAASHFRHSPETITISTHTLKGKVRNLTLRAPKAICHTPGAVQVHVGFNMERYKQWIERHGKEFYRDDRQKEEALTKLQKFSPLGKKTLTEYSQNVASIKATHGKTDYLKQYFAVKKPCTSECNGILRSAVYGEYRQEVLTTILGWMQQHKREISPEILSCVVEKGKTGAVRALLEHGIDPNMRHYQYEGKPPLYMAVEKGHYGIAKALLEQEKIRTGEPCHKTGKTPLHHAVEKGDDRMVALLLRYGAHPQSSDDARKTPMDYARTSGSKEIYQKLVENLEERKASRPPFRQIFGCIPLPFREKCSFVDREEGRRNNATGRISPSVN